MLMTAQDAVQRERIALFSQIRHLCNTCKPPEHLTIYDLLELLGLLTGKEKE